MPFGMVGRTGPWMRQVVLGKGIGQWEGVILGANVGCPIVTTGDFFTNWEFPLRRGEVAA